MTEHSCPQSLEALRRELGRLTPASCVIGGGTDLVIKMRETAVEPDILLHAGAIPEFQALHLTPEVLIIGAGVTMSRLSRALSGAPDLAALSDAARGLGSEQIRNRATIGGNAALALPSGDLLPVLCLLGAEVEVLGPENARRLPIQDFILGPGKSALTHNEIVTSFTIKRPEAKNFTAFVKIGSRRQVTIARLGLAALLELDGLTISRAKVVLGAVAETPVRAESTEAALTGRPLNSETLAGAGAALSQYILDINHRPNREYKAWAGPGALNDACRAIKTAAGL